MDNALIQSVARLKIRLRQDKGIVVNTQRFFGERGYAVQVLDAAEESETLELVELALQLREQMGLISLAPEFGTAAAAPRTTPTTPTARTEAGRYVFGARS